MDVFFLGAGRPSRGDKPSALKTIAQETKALDWQLHSLDALDPHRIVFLGGYHVEEVVSSYPQLHYVIVPDWAHKSVLHTFFEAPLTESGPGMFMYSDTVFRPETISRIANDPNDLVVAYDSSWQQRYERRLTSDMEAAEIIRVGDGQVVQAQANGAQEVEFTGLIKLSERGSAAVRDVRSKLATGSMVDLISALVDDGVRVAAVDVNGAWAEFNAPQDIAHFILGTKAETLGRLESLVTESTIGRQVTFSVDEWRASPATITEHIVETFGGARLVIRSSARSEDGWRYSNAGGYVSLLDVDGARSGRIATAVRQVIESYRDASPDDQILVQEMLSDVAISGVVFTRILETGAPYYRINFDSGGSTESVTAGAAGELSTFVVSRNSVEEPNCADTAPHEKSRTQLPAVDPRLQSVLTAVEELERLLGYDRLDIEFAVDSCGAVHVFQVRPITVDHSAFEVEDHDVSRALSEGVRQFDRLQQAAPQIVGSHTLFGVMPDWNPAEIIGTKPNPLAYSLYRHIITDDIWAKQRAEFGYRDVRPHPLIVSFCGQPYVDIRASLNSFVPADLPDSLAHKLVHHYLERLADNPALHDKLEFEVAFTVLGPTTCEDMESRLIPDGFSSTEIGVLTESLRRLTQQAFTRLSTDISPISLLQDRRKQLTSSDLSPVEKAYALIEDCRSYGTLPFAHAARAGFVAVTFLKGFQASGIVSDTEAQAFLSGIRSVTSEFENDGALVADGRLTQADYAEKFGHLRPGTYDITVQAYWEDPEKYLNGASPGLAKAPSEPYVFRDVVLRRFDEVLGALGLDVRAETFVGYLSDAIRTRESMKFAFTQSLSAALDQLLAYGADVGLSRTELAYLTYQDLSDLRVGALTSRLLRDLVRLRQQQSVVTQVVELPQLIRSTKDFYCFERTAAQPNFITKDVVEAEIVVWEKSGSDDVAGRIVLILQADPGFDWLFGRGIAGLITKYGGANSHMAIRAAELGLPAAIGVGDKIYDSLIEQRRLRLDCAAEQIRPVA